MRNTELVGRGLWVVLCALGIVAHAVPTPAAEEIEWYSSVEDAQSAARASGKPVYFFIFQPSDEACRTMRFTTLRDEKVLALLGAFECCAIDTELRENRPFVQKYSWIETEGEVADVEVKISKLPTNLFMDAGGKELYIRWGYLPAAGFATLLEQIIYQDAQRQALERDPKDARAAANLGHVMLELGLSPEIAREHLDQAVANDPGNATGAREDATLDLVILSIPQDPAKAYEALEAFLRMYPDTGRALEVRYFKAVALAAQDDRAKWQQALELLRTFKTPDRSRPEFDSPWTPLALGLEADLRRVLGR
jgi:thioredoxin-related protein